jgi:small subunit ribosomal protein S16
MAAVIRLSRFGKRHHPTYRVVVTDSRKARNGQFIEQLGFYDPNLKIPDVRFVYDRVMYWLGVGAQPSDTVRSLLKQKGIMALFHEKRAGRSIEGKTPTPIPLKAKKAKLSPKAKARIEAEKAAKAAPAAEAPQG